jgi:hypothetical protein
VESAENPEKKSEYENKEEIFSNSPPFLCVLCALGGEFFVGVL